MRALPSISEERRVFPRAIVEEVFQELWKALEPSMGHGRGAALCERLAFAGGMRRRKAQMKDLEILYIPKFAEEADPGDLFGAKRRFDITDRLLDGMLEAGVLEKRPSKTGVTTWGGQNKLAIHKRTGLPVDLFAATEQSWYNRLVVTTGPSELNILVATLAREKGWNWKVAESGFVPEGEDWTSERRRTMGSEAEVFSFVELPCVEPWRRAGLAEKHQRGRSAGAS